MMLMEIFVKWKTFSNYVNKLCKRILRLLGKGTQLSWHVPFTLKRENVLPTGDFGVRMAMHTHYLDLKRSKTAKKSAAAKKGRKRVEGQREMLLPIEGKQTPQRAAAKKSGARRKAG